MHSYKDLYVAPWWNFFQLAALTFVLFIVSELNDYQDEAKVSLIMFK